MPESFFNKVATLLKKRLAQVFFLRPPLRPPKVVLKTFKTTFSYRTPPVVASGFSQLLLVIPYSYYFTVRTKDHQKWSSNLYSMVNFVNINTLIKY